MYGVDEALAFVLICGLDSEELNPRQCVFGNSDLIKSFQKLGPMVVNVGNHDNVDLGRRVRQKIDCKIPKVRDLMCLVPHHICAQHHAWYTVLKNVLNE